MTVLSVVCTQDVDRRPELWNVESDISTEYKTHLEMIRKVVPQIDLMILTA
jgi:hypothetical protein